MIKNLELTWHSDTQREVFQDPTRFKIYACGRRWGKTKGAQNWAIKKGLLDQKNDLTWWVAPIYSQGKSVFREFNFTFKDFIREKNETELRITYLNGAIIEFKSADKPDNLRGIKIKHLIMDECASQKQSIWTEVLRPGIMDTKADALFLGTPKGQNFFYQLYQQGLQNNNQVKSYHYTTYDNPLIPTDEIDQAKKEMPEALYRQEILAEFIEHIGGVFRNVKECVNNDFEDYDKNEEYVMGVDLGKYNDFTVIIVMKKSNKSVIAFDRFNEVSWELQEQRILNLAEKYRPSILIDQGQVGDAILEDINIRYDNIEGVRFTNQLKNDMVNYLSNLIEKKEISYPEIPIMIEELRIFQYDKTPTGKLKMEAPEGYHDDTVTALMLAAWQCNEIEFNFSDTIETGKGILI